MAKKNILAWLYNISKNKIWILAVISVIGMATAYLSVCLAMLLKSLVDIAVGSVEGDLQSTVVTLSFVILFQMLAGIIISLMSVRVSCKIAIAIKNSIFKKLFYKDWISLTAYHSEEVTNRINSDSAIIANGIVSIIPDLLSLITQIVLGYSALWHLDRTIAVIFLILGPLTLFATKIYGKKVKKLHKACQESGGRVRAFMQECIQNVVVIKSFSNENVISKKADDVQYQDFKLQIKRSYINIIAKIIFFISLTVGYYFAVSFCAVKIANGFMTVGTLTAIMQIVGQIQTPFKDLAATIPQYYAVLASAERICEMEALPDETDKTTVVNVQELYKDMQKIVFENISFRYSEDSEEYIVDNLSFEIEKGKMTALTGKSGAGKSTIIRLMLGIITPQKGRAYILTNSGEKVSLGVFTRKLFAFVPQNIMILSGTILENIVFSDDKPDKEKAIESAKNAEIYDYIMSLPQGFETVLSENGLGMSQGQLQRLAIARALYYGAPVMLLDEITASLDAQNEKAVLGNIKSIEGKTGIIVSHKISSVEECDGEINIDKIKVKDLTS